MNIPRIWLGYARTELSRASLYRQLGGVFMPATVQVMGQLGLQSYIPTVLPKIDNLPDEVALVFYPSPQIYQQACKQSCGGRMYGALHQSLFQFPKSHSSFPERYQLPVEDKKAFMLFDNQPNWQNGLVLTEVWQNQTLTAEEFQGQVATLVEKIKASYRDRLEGVYFYIEKPFVICWSCWRQETQSLISHLPGDVIASIPAEPARVPALFAQDEGIKIAENQSINFQFTPAAL